MAEPEEVVIDAAYRATVGLRELWRRRRPPTTTLRLEHVRRRLELFVTGVLGDCVPIMPAAPRDSRPFFSRLFGSSERMQVATVGYVPTETCLRLPRHIEPSKGWDEDLERYRELALEQMLYVLSERSERATSMKSREHWETHAGRTGRSRSARLGRRPRIRGAFEDEDDARTGAFVVKGDAHESVEDPFGLRRPMDREPGVDPEGLADSLSELPEARLVTSAGAPPEWLLSDEALPRSIAMPSGSRAGRDRIAYPEWDHRSLRYRIPGALVDARAAELGSEGWTAEALSRHGRLIREMRRRFERIRPRYVRRGRQLDGEEIDLVAFVTAYADRVAQSSGDDRLYETRLRLNRDLAVCVLLDSSSSTDAWVSRRDRIIDVEKEALLVVGEALEVLGDRFGILAFSGEGPERVTLSSVKAFGERYGSRVRRRIASLEPEGYTRLGAAVRHATALLSKEQARRKLLLVLSDGRPNDVDWYEGQYGIEDSRQAVFEARSEGIHPFCLTVDRSAPVYAARIFGRGCFTVLHEPERLPRALSGLVQRVAAM